MAQRVLKVPRGSMSIIGPNNEDYLPLKVALKQVGRVLGLKTPFEGSKKLLEAGLVATSGSQGS